MLVIDIMLQFNWCSFNVCLTIVIALQNFLRNKKIVPINHSSSIFPHKIYNIKINIYIFLKSRILEARLRTTTWETYVWQYYAHLCNLLSSLVRINPHACVRHSPHYADILFSEQTRDVTARIKTRNLRNNMYLSWYILKNEFWVLIYTAFSSVFECKCPYCIRWLIWGINRHFSHVSAYFLPWTRRHRVNINYIETYYLRFYYEYLWKIKIKNVGKHNLTMS